MKYDITVTTTTKTHTYKEVKQSSLKTWVESVLNDPELVAFHIVKSRDLDSSSKGAEIRKLERMRG